MLLICIKCLLQRYSLGSLELPLILPLSYQMKRLGDCLWFVVLKEGSPLAMSADVAFTAVRKVAMCVIVYSSSVACLGKLPPSLDPFHSSPYPLTLLLSYSWCSGVSCDACGKGGFSGKRYKCLVCYDFDLCTDCYEAGETGSGRHTTLHPMQCILTRVDAGRSAIGC